MAFYTVTLCDAFGTPLGDASHFESLEYTRVINDVGSLSLVLPGNFDTQLITVPDGRVEVWRKAPGRYGHLDTETIWLIRAWERSIDDAGKRTVTIEADTPLSLFREPGRFVYGAALGSIATKNAAPADNQIKEYAREATTSGVYAEPRRIDRYFTVAPNLGLAPSIAKSAAWRELLKVFQELADASAEQGTYLAFDVVSPTPDTLEFRTFVGQRGVDHRFPSGQNPVIIGPDFGNAGATTLRIDHRDEVTFALAAGRGQNDQRIYETYEDTVRSGASPLGYREKFVEATQYSTSTGVQAEAQAAVRKGRPKTIFQCKILETEDTQYGVHWGWGDFVTAQAFGYSIDARVEAVRVRVAPGEETVEAWVKGDST